MHMEPPQRRWLLHWWGRAYDIIAHHVLHVDDRPHRIALGLAIGVFVAFTPTIGLQTPICVAIAWMLGANKLVGLPVVWISNPATFVPIYYPSYLLGCRLTGNSAVNRAWFSQLAPDGSTSIRQQLQMLTTKFMDIVVPLWIGCLVVAAITSVLTYAVMLVVVKKYRSRADDKRNSVGNCESSNEYFEI